MTEVLFGISAVFVGYVIYVLVDEQMTDNSAQPVFLTPTPPQSVPEKTSKASSRKTTGTPKMKRVMLNKVPEQVGKAAGGVYRYLQKSGAISVAKLVRELKEDSKTIQRSIGWLAQEGKITLVMRKGVEEIALTES